MDEIAGRIELYHSLFIGCLVLSLICLVLAAVLFFFLDIRNVLGYLTGRQRRKKVREMEAANAVSGRLMRERSSMAHVSPEMKTEMGVRQVQTPGARKAGRIVEGPVPVQDENAFRKEPEPPPEQETSLLAENAETDPDGDGSTAVLEGENQEIKGQFLIEREIILIHTQEVI